MSSHIACTSVAAGSSSTGQWRNSIIRRSSAPCPPEHATPVVPRDRAQLGVAEAALAQRVEQARQTGRVAELRGHRRAVEVRAQRDVLYADPLSDVARVGDERAE